MNSAAESQVTPYDTWTSQGAGIYPTGFNPTSGITAGMVRLGTKIRTRDGRTFIFGRVGAVAAVAGSLYQSSAPVPNHLAQTPAAAASGATAVTITTLGATAATANQYAEGFLQVDTTPGNGQMYGINSHLANAGSAVLVVNLEKDDPIQVALTTASRVGLIANPYADVIVSATTQTGVSIGVPLAAFAIGAYGWFQTWGPCPVLINGTPGVGISVVPSATTAGAVDVAAVAAEINTRSIGWMLQVGVSGKNNAVMLRIAQ